MKLQDITSQLTIVHIMDLTMNSQSVASDQQAQPWYDIYQPDYSSYSLPWRPWGLQQIGVSVMRSDCTETYLWQEQQQNDQEVKLVPSFKSINTFAGRGVPTRRRGRHVIYVTNPLRTVTS